MSKYQMLIAKSELAEQTARNSETQWASEYWRKVSKELKEQAYSLPLEEMVAE